MFSLYAPPLIAMGKFVILRLSSARAIALAASVALAGCTPLGSQIALTPTSPMQTKYYASDEDLQAGVKHFESGAFGLAQERFQKAVEKAPTDITAWIALGASYDRLRRFDLADRAYDQAVKLGGVTAAVLNNKGYSSMLRGDVVMARAHFSEAYRLDPQNPAIANNLRLLDGSRRHVRRLDGAY